MPGITKDEHDNQLKFLYTTQVNEITQNNNPIANMTSKTTKSNDSWFIDS